MACLAPQTARAGIGRGLPSSCKRSRPANRARGGSAQVGGVVALGGVRKPRVRWSAGACRRPARRPVARSRRREPGAVGAAAARRPGRIRLRGVATRALPPRFRRSCFDSQRGRPGPARHPEGTMSRARRGVATRPGQTVSRPRVRRRDRRGKAGAASGDLRCIRRDPSAPLPVVKAPGLSRDRRSWREVTHRRPGSTRQARAGCGCGAAGATRHHRHDAVFAHALRSAPAPKPARGPAVSGQMIRMSPTRSFGSAMPSRVILSFALNFRTV